jgi:thiamine-phosphate pyrophosphorylase
MSDQYSQSRWQEPAICRILDANLDRAREGLRIIEEWCRFGLNSAQMAGECKQMRQELASWHTQELRAARDTPGDPGTELTHPRGRTTLQHPATVAGKSLPCRRSAAGVGRIWQAL